MDLFFGIWTDPNGLGPRKGFTRLSAFGPGCSGSILSLVTDDHRDSQLALVSALRSGRAGLYTRAAGASPFLRFPMAERRVPGALVKLWHSYSEAERPAHLPPLHSP